MTNRHFFLLAGIMVLIGLMGLSCSVYKEGYFTPTRTSTPLIEISAIPSTAPSPTPIPTFQILLPSTAPPYPTASTVNANAVAFIAGNSLWIANVDGSGERKLVDFEKNNEWISSHLLRWSPDGKWIGYIPGDDLWIISPDGSVNRRILSIQDTPKKIVRQYAWSPDSSKIVYALAENWFDFTEIKTGLLDLTTQKESELFVYQSPTTITLSWSPNGSNLLFNRDSSFFVYEVDTRKFVNEIRSIDSCWATWHDSLVWSPDSEWFYYTGHGNGYHNMWICISGLNGTSWRIGDVGVVISSPVWDKTGDYLYFVVGEMNLDIGPNWCKDQRLVRYSVEARKLETLLSLEKYAATGFPWTISISPNKRMLELYSYAIHEDYSHPKQNKFVVLDTQSFTTKEFTLEFEGEVKSQLPPSTWSSDNQKIVFFLRDLVCQSYGLSYSDYGSFYSLDVKTGKVFLVSGGHVVENAQVSPIAISP
jgi:hypothetical protein